jgi:hypothetical protein
MSKSLSRRSFLRMVSAFAASGALDWVSKAPKVEEGTQPVIGVDIAETGDDETAIVVATLSDDEQPFVPYYLPPGKSGRIMALKL